MNVAYLAQPDGRLGSVLSEMLNSNPKSIVFVSAFVGLQTIVRVKDQVKDLKDEGSDIRFVFGIDLGGTSQEVLQEVLGWNIDVRIVKHRIPGHTFHPKLYVLEWDDKAEIIIGSNNITEGGFFGNYEGAARISYTLPEESSEFNAARRELQRFLDPDGPIVQELTEDLLQELISRKEVPSEAAARPGRNVGAKEKRSGSSGGEHLFGTEDIEPPPPLPAHLLEGLIKDVRRRRRAARKAATKPSATSRVEPPISSEEISDPLLPAAFYMTLPTLQGPSIPGEARIPLEAIELAKEFWGWPDEYTQDISPRAGKERVYWNWRPIWKVASVEVPVEVVAQEVRMYMYENSSVFRFYARPLVNAGGNLGDVVRIRRIAQPDAEYECGFGFAPFPRTACL